MEPIMNKGAGISETREFQKFSDELDYLASFFVDLSDLINHYGRIINYYPAGDVYNFDASLLMSSSKTIQSVKLCCSIGSFSDANTLIRKLRDDLIQFLYILHVVTSHSPFSKESLDNAHFDVDDPNDFKNAFESLKVNYELTADEEAVAAWFRNSSSTLKWGIKKKLDFSNYMSVLKENSNIKHILETYELHEYWESLRRKLNDYVHNNGSLYANFNVVKSYNKHLGSYLKKINHRISYISSVFISMLLMIDSSLISSSDYSDYMNMGLVPPKNSQYSIAWFVQEFIDIKIVMLHPELKDFLKDNNIHGMRIV